MQIEDRTRDDEFGAGFDLVVETAELLLDVRRGRIHRHADVKRRRRANRLAADVAAVIQARDDVGQADRVDIEHRRRVGIVADAARIAGDEQQVPHAHRVRAQQIGLDTEEIPIATGVMQQRFDSGLLLDEHRQRQRADARARALAVGNADQVDAADLEAPRALDHLIGLVPARRHHLDRDDERAAREQVRKPRFLVANHWRSV